MAAAFPFPQEVAFSGFSPGFIRFDQCPEAVRIGGSAVVDTAFYPRVLIQEAFASALMIFGKPVEYPVVVAQHAVHILIVINLRVVEIPVAKLLDEIGVHALRIDRSLVRIKGIGRQGVANR